MSKRPDNIKRLFLDANGIIHTTSYNIFSAYEKELRELNKGKDPSEVEEYVRKNIKSIYSKLERNVFREVLSYIVNLYRVAKPTELLYISFDGVAPRSKMEQQKCRRFKSQKEIQTKMQIYKKHNTLFLLPLLWDSNCITPGTEFMKNLSSYIHSNLQRYVSIPCCLSDTSVFGEGEHKIVKYIKENRTDKADVIYGLDADLMMLAMSCHPQQIYLLRERVEFDKKFVARNVPFCYLSIDSLKDSIIDHMKILGGNFEETNYFRGIRDYIFLCFLMGNDFLPHQECLVIKDGGIDYLLEKYLLLKKDEFLIKDDLSINQEILMSLFYMISKEEDEMVREKYRDLIKFRPRHRGDKEKSDLDREIDELNWIKNRTFEKEIEMGTEGWRERFYTSVVETSDVKSMCLEYLQGLRWTLYYYFDECLDNKWYYSYQYGPTFKDIIGVLKEVNLNELLPKSPDKLTTYQQLSIVLPQRSHRFIPLKIRTHLKNKYNKYYPVDFSVKTFGKKHMWESYPIVETMDKATYSALLDDVAELGGPDKQGCDIWFNMSKINVK
jgi:5'-3' exonuclease